MQYLSLSEASEYTTSELSKMVSEYNQKYNTQIIVPTLTWRAMGFRTAGRAFLERHRIEMNTNYLQSKDAVEFIISTLKHELAHLIAYREYGSHGHDYSWRMVAYRLGDDGNRCHNYATPENKPLRNRIKLTCTCGTEFIMTERGFKSINRYQCKHCHTPLSKLLDTKEYVQI